MTATIAVPAAPHLHGVVHYPGDSGYDAARATWNPAVDARPIAVVEPGGPADVTAALAWARAHDVPLAVQATGHGVVVPADDALLLKTSRMSRVLVDPDRRIARVGPGTQWADVIAAAAPFGLVPLSGSAPSVGVAGYTLGGGLSWLSRRFGFAADSLLRATVVIADGRVVPASRERHPELFWALRGGGGNFGLVTSLDIALYPVARVVAGTATFGRERAAELVAAYRDWTATVPDELSTALVVTTAGVELRVMHAGPGDDARRALRQLYRVAGAPVTEDFVQRPYAEVRMPGIPPRSFDLFRTLPDPVIRTVADAEATVEIRHWGGAMARPASDAGPVGHRDVPFSIIVDGPAEIAHALRRYATGGSFLNFLHGPTETAYTAANYQRLRVLKRRYDPDNVFHHNHNVPPEATR